MVRRVEPSGEVVARSAVRLLLLSPNRELLLVHYVTPDTDEDFWCTPGGALDPGEDDVAAVTRELREELGFEMGERALGTVAGTRSHIFVIGDGRTFHQSERFYRMDVDAFEPVPQGLSDFERRAIRGMRWWPLDELRTTTETVSPRRLADLVETIMSGEATGPIDMGT